MIYFGSNDPSDNLAGATPDNACPICLANAPQLSSSRNSAVSVGVDMRASPIGREARSVRVDVGMLFCCAAAS